MKKILIPAWKVGPNSFGVTIPYLMFASYFGSPVIANPGQRPEDFIDVDGVILPGGADVNPERYGEEAGFMSGNIDPHKENFDRKFLPFFIENNYPVFGICRGFQSLNIYFGGSIEQHFVHEQSIKSRDELVHSVEAQDNFERVTDTTKKFKVNSLHHQCVFDENVPDELNPILRHDKDDVVEGLIHERKPVAGVQYHPEETMDDFAIRLFEFILEMQNENVK